MAVAVLGLVAAGSLRLSIAASKTMNALEGQSELIRSAKSLETAILNGSKPDNGEENGLSWRSSPLAYAVMDGLWKINFRQLEVTLDGHSITLYIP